jgi:fluoride exporter
MKFFIIGIGGFIGAVLRYTISGWVQRLFTGNFPYGTLAVNIIGSFILGYFLFISEGRFVISPGWRNFVAIGMMGALTTFSTFSYETVMLLQDNLYFQAGLNTMLNVTLTLIAVWLGMVIARLV